jgi:type IV secretion system protein VirB5
MFRKPLLTLPLIALFTFGAVRPAAAQWAVIDVASVAQLVQQYQTLQQELTTVQDHLAQARQEYASLTGGRGMERLLAGQVRNYLPSSWAALSGTMQGAGGAYGGLGASAQSILAANAVLAGPTLARLSPTERAHLDGARHSTALPQALTRQALATTSGRFSSLQQLIDAIPTAGDPKAILDLQARIAAEEGMLTNEGSKLQVLYQAAQAEAASQHQRRDEQAIADIGSLRALPAMGLR